VATGSAAGPGGAGGTAPSGPGEKPPFDAQKGTYRTHGEVMRFFDGLTLVEPGMVRIQQWRPRSQAQAGSAAAMWGGVGRRP